MDSEIRSREEEKHRKDIVMHWDRTPSSTATEFATQRVLRGRITAPKGFNMNFLVGLCSCFFCFSLALTDHESEKIESNLFEFTITNGIQEKVGSRFPRQVPYASRREIRPLITDFTVKSTIISRYAFTAVSCTMVNRAIEAKEVVFQMQIPAAAFVSNFTMIIGGRTYHSEVTWRKKTGENNIQEYDKIIGDGGFRRSFCQFLDPKPGVERKRKKKNETNSLFCTLLCINKAATKKTAKVFSEVSTDLQRLFSISSKIHLLGNTCKV
ncbi:unnamed protein product [Ranitomeya imitator]|uniref:VIT domain-containing protein n=1 Tax=Ranitomeya imitator TaxID=111125 RepID=A0ABN9KW76_9NEOB|nr:unnamed protein product [Ranitomeya imitator]